MASPPMPRHVEWVYDRRSSARARSALDTWARDQDIAPADRSRLVLVLSEMVSNAAQATEAPFRVLADLVEEAQPRVRVTVINEGAPDDLPDQAEWGPSSPLAVRGRGLGVIDAVADEVEIVKAAPGKIAISATVSLAH